MMRILVMLMFVISFAQGQVPVYATDHSSHNYDHMGQEQRLDSNHVMRYSNGDYVAFSDWLRHPEKKSSDNLDTFHGCPMTGSAKDSATARSNALKNRWHELSPILIENSITIHDMMRAKRYELNETNGATITGYCIEVKVGGGAKGAENCNCMKTGEDNTDVHIVLTDDSTKITPDHRVIVEVTPRWKYLKKLEGLDWSTKTLRTKLLHHWIRVTGFLFADAEHAKNAFNTAKNPKSRGVWRASVMEIHPTTNIDVLLER